MQTSTESKYKCVGQGQCKQRQPNTSRDEKKSFAKRWIPKNMVHHIDYYWAWVPKSIQSKSQLSTQTKLPNKDKEDQGQTTHRAT